MNWIKCSDSLPGKEGRNKRFLVVLAYILNPTPESGNKYHYWIATALYYGNEEWRLDLSDNCKDIGNEILYWSKMPHLPDELLKDIK